MVADVPRLAKHAAALTSIAAASLDPDVVLVAEARVIIGQANSTGAATAVSGDITINASGVTAVGANKIATAMIKDDAITADKLSSADDFTVGTIEAAGKIQGLPIQTEDGHHTGVALADLTAAFGAPGTLPNGALFTYKNDTDAKVYLVAVVGSVFQAVEMTHITA